MYDDDLVQILVEQVNAEYYGAAHPQLQPAYIGDPARHFVSHQHYRKRVHAGRSGIEQ